MLGRMSATCRLYFEVPELAGMMCCVSVRYRSDTYMMKKGTPHSSCEGIHTSPGVKIPHCSRLLILPLLRCLAQSLPSFCCAGQHDKVGRSHLRLR